MLIDTALLYFHGVVEYGSIRRAAQKLHVSPSAVSRMIAKLEHHYRTELFERRPKGMVLTESGRAVAEQVGHMVHHLSLIQSDLDELKGLVRGTVALECIEGVAQEVVPRVLDRIHAHYPGMDFRVNVKGTDSIVESLHADKIDLGITFTIDTPSSVEPLLCIPQQLHLLAAPGHPLASASTVSLEDAFNYPVALSNTSFGTRRIIDAALRKLAIQPPKSLVTANSLTLTYGMARRGTCLTFSVPIAAQQALEKGDLIAVPLKERHLLTGRVALCKRHDRRLSVAARELARAIQAEFETLAG